MWARLREVCGDQEQGCEMDAGIKCQDQPSEEESICRGAKACLLRMSMSMPGVESRRCCRERQKPRHWERNQPSPWTCSGGENQHSVGKVSVPSCSQVFLVVFNLQGECCHWSIRCSCAVRKRCPSWVLVRPLAKQPCAVSILPHHTLWPYALIFPF